MKMMQKPRPYGQHRANVSHRSSSFKKRHMEKKVIEATGRHRFGGIRATKTFDTSNTRVCLFFPKGSKCTASESLIITGSFGCGLHADLVDDGEDGVDQHQVVRLDGQVVGLLQSKQHRSYQGDLGGA